MLLAWGMERGREGFGVCAVSLASLGLLCGALQEQGWLCVPGPSQNPATVNTWHPLLPSLVGVEALEPTGKSCGSLGGAWEILWK